MPNRDLENKQFLSLAFISSTVQINPLPSVMEMDINKVDNCDDIRRSPSSNKVSSRSISISSSISSIPYHERIVINNDLTDKEFKKPVDSSQLSYKSDSQGKSCVSMATDPTLSQKPQHVLNETLALNTCNASHVNNDIINIQLPYDPDWPTEPELWNGNFHYISLHSFLEHLPSNANNIKNSLICMVKYIKNKKIDLSKSNNIKDLEDIGEAAWKFVSAIYKSRWDFLVTNSYNNIFRQKILYHCTLKTNSVKHSKKEEKENNKPANIK